MKHILLTCLALILCASLSGCMPGQGAGDRADAAVPGIPAKLERNGEGVPVLSVYDAAAGAIERMDLETYVAGVVAGEMKNDWPMEALKAQAILARTFVLRFCQDKTSKYDGADISTDVAEAQAYAAADVNARVRRAVEATRGQVMSFGGEYPYAWFHAHSGGMTELPSVALDFRGGDPDYLRPTASGESEKAPDGAKQWTVTFTADEVRKAAAEAGLRVDALDSLRIGERGASGRAATLLINGESVSAPSFRIRVGANRLRSTLIDQIRIDGDRITFTGRGYGHGVGMSQWGAYAMAEEGKTAAEIIGHYFRDVDIVRAY